MSKWNPLMELRLLAGLVDRRLRVRLDPDHAERYEVSAVSGLCLKGEWAHVNVALRLAAGAQLAREADELRDKLIRGLPTALYKWVVHPRQPEEDLVAAYLASPPAEALYHAVLDEVAAFVPSAIQALRRRGSVLAYADNQGRRSMLRQAAELIANVAETDGGTAWQGPRDPHDPEMI